MATIHDLQSPSLLIDQTKLAANIARMQDVCDRNSVELRPHIKTHKLVPVARQQLSAGARGLTCAKLGEAEAMLPSGVRELFVAHSIVDPKQASRIAALIERTDDFRLAVTSEAHVEVLNRVASLLGRKLHVMMAIDTGLHREGARSLASAQEIAALTGASRHLELRGFFTHEGWFYGSPFSQRQGELAAMLASLTTIRDAIDPTLDLWPGCSVTAAAIAATAAGSVQAVRPGAYLFGDLALTRVTGVMQDSDVAVHVLATVVDKPEPGLALIDAGSKTFSSDRTPGNLFAIAADGRDIQVVRVNEEHGYLRGSAVDALEIGERILFTPAHVCTAINLTDEVAVVRADGTVDFWKVDARGRTQ